MHINPPTSKIAHLRNEDLYPLDILNMRNIRCKLEFLIDAVF